MITAKTKCPLFKRGHFVRIANYFFAGAPFASAAGAAFDSVAAGAALASSCFN
jgi:hypothetical protein